jgi:hypothetical protein
MIGWAKKMFGGKNEEPAEDSGGAGVRSYFDAVRAHYLEVLRRGIHDASKSGGQVVVEAAASIEAEDGKEVSMPGELGLPYRYDIVCIDENGGAQPIMPVGDHSIEWEPAAFEFGQFIARVEHLVWNVCVVVGKPAPPPARRELLRGWFLKWFKNESNRDAPFSGVVHFMGDPEESESGELLRVQVDLGSAPSDALVELLGVFGQMGCRDGLVYTPEGALEAEDHGLDE